MRSIHVLILSMTMLAATLGCRPAPPKSVAKSGRLVAQAWNSGFADAHDSYNAMGTGSDGKIYYVLSSEKHDVAAQMFSFDPAAQNIQHLGDLTEACGEKG